MSRLIFGIDPGEKLNGVAVLAGEEGSPANTKLILGVRISTDKLAALIEKAVPQDPIICFEQYRVYPGKLKEHRFSRVQTVESIGVIEYLVRKYALTTYRSLAVTHKNAITTNWLKCASMWGDYDSTSAPHIRDATKVAVYWFKCKGILNNGKPVITDADKLIIAQHKTSIDKYLPI